MFLVKSDQSDIKRHYQAPPETRQTGFDIRFIRQDQTQRRNGNACRGSPTCFWSSLINLSSKDTIRLPQKHVRLALISGLSGKTRHSVGMAMLADPVQHVSGGVSG